MYSAVNLVGAALREGPSAGARTGRRRYDTKKTKCRQHGPGAGYAVTVSGQRCHKELQEEAGRGHQALGRCTLGSKGWLHGHVQSQPQISHGLILE